MTQENINTNTPAFTQQTPPVPQPPPVPPSQVPAYSTPQQTEILPTEVETEKKKPKGCFSIFLIVIGALFVLFLIASLTSSLWFTSVFKSIFSEDKYENIYMTPAQRIFPTFKENPNWNKVESNLISFSVPFGEILATEYLEKDQIYEYAFEDGSFVDVVEPAYATNAEMKTSCLISYDNFYEVKGLPTYIEISLLLSAKTVLLNTTGWGSTPYYFEKDDLFVCQMGDPRKQSESYNLLVIPNKGELESLSNYYQIMIFNANPLEQSDIDQIVSSIFL